MDWSGLWDSKCDGTGSIEMSSTPLTTDNLPIETDTEVELKQGEEEDKMEAQAEKQADATESVAPILTAYPPTCTVTASAGVSAHQLTNKSTTAVTEQSKASQVETIILEDNEKTINEDNATGSTTEVFSLKVAAKLEVDVNQRITGDIIEPVIDKQVTGTTDIVVFCSLALTAYPPLCTVAATGGVSAHQLTNKSTERLVFKVKSSNNKDYRILPVFGFVESGVTTVLHITRTAGVPKEDKLVVQYGPAPADITDATQAFKAVNSVKSITIPIKATL